MGTDLEPTQALTDKLLTQSMCPSKQEGSFTVGSPVGFLWAS